MYAFLYTTLELCKYYPEQAAPHGTNPSYLGPVRAIGLYPNKPSPSSSHLLPPPHTAPISSNLLLRRRPNRRPRSRQQELTPLDLAIQPTGALERGRIPARERAV